jgi:hypothetical protein
MGGGRTIIDPGGGGGGGGSSPVSAASKAGVSVPGLRQLLLSGFKLVSYGEVGRLDVQAPPQTLPLLAPSAAVAWAAQPAALTELLGLAIHRGQADLAGCTEARLVVNVSAAGVAGAKLRAQYSLDLAAWAYLDGVSGPSVDIGSAGLQASAWTAIEAAAAADVFLRLVGIDGNGIASPSLGAAFLQVR